MWTALFVVIGAIIIIAGWVRAIFEMWTLAEYLGIPENEARWVARLTATAVGLCVIGFWCK